MYGPSIPSLLNTNSKEVRIIHMDTEGTDWEISKELSLNKYSPRLIVFEHNHLSKTNKYIAFSYLNTK